MTDPRGTRSASNELLALAVARRPPASAVLSLASDDSSYVTGIELFVDGGTARI